MDSFSVLCRTCLNDNSNFMNFVNVPDPTFVSWRGLQVIPTSIGSSLYTYGTITADCWRKVQNGLLSSQFLHFRTKCSHVHWKHIGALVKCQILCWEISCMHLVLGIRTPVLWLLHCTNCPIEHDAHVLEMMRFVSTLSYISADVSLRTVSLSNR